jgi:hypothetical protein
VICLAYSQVLRGKGGRSRKPFGSGAVSSLLDYPRFSGTDLQVFDRGVTRKVENGPCDPSAKLRWQVLGTSSMVAVVVVTLSGLVYPLNVWLLATMLVSIAAGGVRSVAVAYYRSRARFAAALMLTASLNATLLIASAMAFAVRSTSCLLPAVTMSVGLCATALLGSRVVAAERLNPRDSGDAYPWSEGWSAVSFIGAGMVLGALERLVTPEFLGLPEMATLSVLASIVGSPFQMLHVRVGYTLVPGLRNASGRVQRRRAFVHEGAVVGIACLAAGIAVWWVTPLVLKFVLAGRYEISWQLLLAAIGVGVLKVSGALAAAAVNALGSAGDLLRLSVVGWTSIGLALIGAGVGAHWGLTGLVCGIGFGWLARALMVTGLAAPHLSHSARADEYSLRMPDPTGIHFGCSQDRI